MTEQVWLGVLSLLGSIVAIVSVIVTFKLQERRAAREAADREKQRLWDLQDREAARARSEARASEITGTVLKAVDVNTAITSDAAAAAATAAKAATAAHEKIEAVGAVRRTDMSKRATDAEG